MCRKEDDAEYSVGPEELVTKIQRSALRTLGGCMGEVKSLFFDGFSLISEKMHKLLLSETVSIDTFVES